MNKFTGLIAAVYTPMHEDGSLNLEVIPFYANHLHANGIRGIFVCGTTGEGASLTIEERMQVTQAWTDLKIDDFHIIVHVGHNSLQESKKLARHAQNCNADAFSVIAPSFYKPLVVLDLVNYCAEIAAECPGLPFFFYHMPSICSVYFDMFDFLQELNDRIPNFEGIKFTHENLMDFALCLNHNNGAYNILFGRDEILLCALVLGAKGAVGSTYNLIAPLFLELMDAFGSGEIEKARSKQMQVNKFIQVLIKYGGGVVGGKAIMKLTGIDCGPVRLPLKPVLDINSLHMDLEQIGFYDYCCKSRTL